jgi:uncharacterized FlaG/YvyC family protein
MGQLSVTGLRAVVSPEPQQGTAAHNQRGGAQAIVSAVHVINQSGLIGADREVTYSKDSATRQLVIQVVDKQSKEVIVQWPSEYALQLAQEFQKEYPDL